MMIEYRQAEKIFKENNIEVSSDGVGNTSIFYRLENGKQVLLGGYIDMEPFKWHIHYSWSVGGTKDGIDRLPWSIYADSPGYVEHRGYYWVNNKEDEFCDQEFVDAILAAKDELLKVLPDLKKRAREIAKKFRDVDIDSSIKPTHSGKWLKGTFYPPRWIAVVNWKGKQFVGEARDSYLEAKEDHDKFIKQAVEEDQNEK